MNQQTHERATEGVSGRPPNLPAFHCYRTNAVNSDTMRVSSDASMPDRASIDLVKLIHSYYSSPLLLNAAKPLGIPCREISVLYDEA